MALDLGALAGKVLEKIPWPVLVAFALMGGWVWYERSSKAEAVAAAQADAEGAVGAVLATTSDDKNAKISALEGNLCACRVQVARCEATLVAPQPPKVVVRRVAKVVDNPEPESCE